MTTPDPLRAVKDELQEAGRKEAGWLRLATMLRRDGADPDLVKEALEHHQAARARREFLAEYLRSRGTPLPIEQPKSPPLASEPGAGTGEGRSGHSILVVDDHAPTRYATARALRAFGFQTLEGAEGADALELAPYASGVVLDVHLPDLDGFQVCRMLRANSATASVPVIHLSARYVTAADRSAGLDAGADAYFVAPANPVLLAQSLDRLIAERG